MGRWHPTTCADCGTTEGPISAKGYCIPCAIKRQTDNLLSMTNKEGPVYNTWRERMREVAEGL